MNQSSSLGSIIYKYHIPLLLQVQIMEMITYPIGLYVLSKVIIQTGFERHSCLWVKQVRRFNHWLGRLD